MKKQLACILLIISISAFITGREYFSEKPTYPSILDSEQRPSNFLCKILELTHIEHDGTLKNIVTLTQKEQPIGFIRSRGKERWEISDIHEDKRIAIIETFEQMGILDTLLPTKTHYNYVLVHGATLDRAQTRMFFLIDLYNHGIRFDAIIILSGKRLLTDDEKKRLNYAAENEYEMVQVVWNQLDLPEGLKQLPTLFVDSPMKEKNGVILRPTTADTIITWLKSDPKPGSALTISNQPFCDYQDCVTRTYMPNSFEIETVGPAADQDEIRVSVLLDNLARWLYQENLRHSGRKDNPY